MKSTWKTVSWALYAAWAVAVFLYEPPMPAGRSPGERPAASAAAPAADHGHVTEPVSARPEKAEFPYRLAACGRPASVEVAPMLAAITAAQGDFNLALRPGESDWPVGCSPFAVAVLCHHYGFPQALPRREMAINVGGSAAAWTVGGARYPYAKGGRMAGLQPLMVDVGALAKTEYDRSGSGTGWKNMEGALGELGFRFGRAATLADVLASVRHRRPALVSVTLDSWKPDERHCAVADGIGSAGDGSAALHLRFFHRRADDGGWYSVGTDHGGGLSLHQATVDVVPGEAPFRTVPVILAGNGP